MKKTFYFFLVMVSIASIACGQEKPKTAKSTLNKKNSKMDLSKLTDANVKAAFEAWQNGDSAKQLAFFTADAKLFDDGNPRDFHSFSTQTIGKEKFITIDKIGQNGTEITGSFHSPQWGDFKTYFRFHTDGNGKFNRLDIGQAN